jgi:hypothetical protein
MSKRNKKPEVSYNDFEKSFMKWASNFTDSYNKTLKETNKLLPFPLRKGELCYDYFNFFMGGHVVREAIMERFIKLAFKLDKKSINSLPKHVKNRVLMMLMMS